MKTKFDYEVSIHPIHNKSDKWWSFTGNVEAISEKIPENIQQSIDKCNAERETIIETITEEEKEIDVISRYIIVRKEYERFCQIRNQKHSIVTAMDDEFLKITSHDGFEVFRKAYNYYKKVETKQELEQVKQELEKIKYFTFTQWFIFSPEESLFIEFKKLFLDYIERMEKILEYYIYHRVR